MRLHNKLLVGYRRSGGSGPPPNENAMSALLYGGGVISADLSPAGGETDLLLGSNPLYSLRADKDALITVANGAVQTWASDLSAPNNATQSTVGDRPTHVAADDLVQLRGPGPAGTSGTTGKFLQIPALGALINGTSSATPFGVFALFKMAQVPTGSVHIFRVGYNTSSFAFADRMTFRVYILSDGSITAQRASSAASANATTGASYMTGKFNTWIAMAAVFNDGSGNNITKLRLKPLGGSQTNYTSSALAVGSSGLGNWTQNSAINYSLFNNSAGTVIGDFDLHSFAIGTDPTVLADNTTLDANINRMLARV